MDPRLKYEEAVCGNLSAHELERGEVQTETAFWTWSSTLFMTVPSILVDCYLGAWSDVVGRKYTLLMPPVGAIAGTAVYIVKGEGKQMKLLNSELHD